MQEEDDLPVRQKKCKDDGKPAIKIQSYQGQDEATAAVASGKADAMLADSPGLRRRQAVERRPRAPR